MFLAVGLQGFGYATLYGIQIAGHYIVQDELRRYLETHPQKGTAPRLMPIQLPDNGGGSLLALSDLVASFAIPLGIGMTAIDIWWHYSAVYIAVASLLTLASAFVCLRALIRGLNSEW